MTETTFVFHEGMKIVQADEKLPGMWASLVEKLGKSTCTNI
jgi:hypothetical protein